jgi:hypothetical protein
MAMKSSKATTEGQARASKAILVAFTTVMAVLVCIIALNLLANRVRLRWDLTATKERSLAARTRVELARLDAPYRLVVLGDMSTIDSRARRRLEDVLNEMRERSDNFRYTFIDTSSPRGMSSFERLVLDLQERESENMHQQTKTIEFGITGATALSTYLSSSLATALQQIAELVPASSKQLENTRSYLLNASARASVASQDLLAAASGAQDALRNRVGEVPLPQTDLARDGLVKATAPALDFLASIHKDLTTLAASPLTAGPPAEASRDQLPRIEQQRSSAALLADSLRRMERLDLTRLVDVLRAQSCAVLIGPEGKGMTAIDLPALFPTTQYAVEGTGSADLSRRIEDVLATALSSLRVPQRPIVVIAHGEVRPFFDDVPLFTDMIASLRRRGMDVVEWAAAKDPDPPSITALDPRGDRPVVYVSLSPDSSARASERGELSGLQRAELLAKALSGVVSSGKPLLVSLNPSIAPSQGGQDPLTEVIQPFGLTADSGRPLLREIATPRGPAVETDRTVQPSEGGHPLTGAVRGLPTFFPWPIAIIDRESPPGSRVTTSPLYTLPADPVTWAESKWLPIWETPRDKRGGLELPQFDPSDARWPEGSETNKPQFWRIAVASERFEVGKSAQRLIVVGSNSWYLDQLTRRTMTVDGRTVAAYPGNAEFFEASVYWLAGQDDLIAQSPSATAVSIVQPMDSSKLGRVRVGVIVVMPCAALLLGLLFRLIRG